MPGLHAKKSPSGAKRWHECPGSFAMVDSLPPEMRSGSGQASKLGTISHYLLETCLREMEEPVSYMGRLIQITDEGTEQEDCVLLKPKARLPKNTKDRANTFEVNDEVVENVTLAYDYVMEQCSALKVDPRRLKLETRTNPCPDRDDTSGTADVTIDAWPKLLELVDYKNGRITVEHKDNPQVLAYLAGKAHDEGWDYAEYALSIVQPNGRHEEGKVRRWVVPKETLLEFVDKHRAAAERADDASDTFPGWTMDPSHENAGKVMLEAGNSMELWEDINLKAGDHCGFCDASHVCPAYRAFRQKQAREDDWDRDPETGEVEVPDLKSFRVTAAAEAREILQRAPFLQGAIKRAYAYLAAEAKAGRMPAGVKFVRKRGKREWDPELQPHTIADKMVAEGMVNENEVSQLYKPTSLITGPQAEALVPKDRRKEFNDMFLVKPDGGLKLVLDTDPGEPVAFDVGAEFEDVEEFEP